MLYCDSQVTSLKFSKQDAIVTSGVAPHLLFPFPLPIYQPALLCSALTSLGELSGSPRKHYVLSLFSPGVPYAGCSLVVGIFMNQTGLIN